MRLGGERGLAFSSANGRRAIEAGPVWVIEGRIVQAVRQLGLSDWQAVGSWEDCKGLTERDLSR